MSWSARRHWLQTVMGTFLLLWFSIAVPSLSMGMWILLKVFWWFSLWILVHSHNWMSWRAPSHLLIDVLPSFHLSRLPVFAGLGTLQKTKSFFVLLQTSPLKEGAGKHRDMCTGERMGEMVKVALKKQLYKPLKSQNKTSCLKALSCSRLVSEESLLRLALKTSCFAALQFLFCLWSASRGRLRGESEWKQ